MRQIVALTILILAFPTAAQEDPSRVTISVAEYDRLRKGIEAPAATVVDTVLLSGSFAERNLAITLTGRASGTRPLVKVLDQADEVTISACKGSAILSRSGKGAFDLIPLADAFDLRCELRMSGSDRLHMHAAPSVLAVRSTVTDGELVTSEEDAAGARDYTLVRHVTGPGETLAATATGRYLITLLPDATRFRYSIDVHNPNRTTSTLELALQSGEHLQQIDAPYEVRDGRYVFSIPPGDSAITMTGELRGTSFTAPVRASLQYLVLESHPLLRPTIKTPAKRIALAETGITPQYRGAIALEAANARIEWQVTRLEALHAISYAINNAAHRLFVPIDGPVLGESTFELRNEGAAELVLPPQPEPTYVSLANEPVLMTKNAAGQLTIPLSPGEQAALVQHRQPLARRLGIAAGSVTIPQLSVPATMTHVTLSYPGQWIPLYESFASRAHFGIPSGGRVALFLVLAFWIERLLAWLAMPARRRFVIALLTALAATIVNAFLVVVIVACGAVTLVWILTQATIRRRVLYGTLAAAVVLVVLFGYFASNISSRESSSSGSYEYSTDTSSVTRAAKVDAPAAAEPQQQATPTYQGLPAKFTLPSGERSSHFSQELLRTDRAQRAFIIAISATLANWIGVAIALIALLLLWRDRRWIADTIRARLAPRPAPAPSPEPA